MVSRLLSRIRDDNLKGVIKMRTLSRILLIVILAGLTLLSTTAESQVVPLPEKLILRSGIVRATINGVAFTTTFLEGRWDLVNKIGHVKVKFSNVPKDFFVLASSGSSHLSWSNGLFNMEGQAIGLGTLSGWNYMLERTNVFPDGNKIAMRFKVLRVSPTEITMEADWEGKYALGIDIVHMEQPIIEELISEAPGRVRGYYQYVLVRSDGTRIPVDTFSTYTFTPVIGSTGLLPFPLKRITTNSWFWDPERLELTIVAQTLIVPLRR